MVSGCSGYHGGEGIRPWSTKPQNGHAGSELERVVDPEECVDVIGQCDEAADPNLVQALCPAEDADHDLVDLLARDEQQPGLDRAVRDLDEGASLRDEADAP